VREHNRSRRRRGTAQIQSAPMSRNVIEEAREQIVLFLHRFGWYIVLAGLVIVFSQPYLKTLREKQSLAAANDPLRRKVLDNQRLRVRLAQQKAVAGQIGADSDAEDSAAPQ
jgi:hypothetical protein